MSIRQKHHLRGKTTDWRLLLKKCFHGGENATCRENHRILFVYAGEIKIEQMFLFDLLVYSTVTLFARLRG